MAVHQNSKFIGNFWHGINTELLVTMATTHEVSSYVKWFTTFACVDSVFSNREKEKRKFHFYFQQFVTI